MNIVIAFGLTIAIAILVLATVVKHLTQLITETTNLVRAFGRLKATLKRFRAKK